MIVDIVNGDDWNGIYLDEKLYHEGHSIPDFIWRVVLEKVGADPRPTLVRHREADLDWLMDEGRLPATIHEVVFASE